MARHASRTRDDRVELVTRAVAVAVVPVLVFGSASLLVFPARTRDFFAWEIASRMIALLLGSAYAAGLYLFVRVALARRFHHIGAALPPIAVFAALILVATFVHLDVFFTGTGRFVLWLAAYGAAPPLLVLAWPGRMAEAWAWPLTPLTSQVVGAWLVWGAFALLLARDGRSSSCRIVFQAMALGLVLTLASAIRAREELDPAAPFTCAFIGTATAVVPALVAFYVRMERWSRSGSTGS